MKSVWQWSILTVLPCFFLLGCDPAESIGSLDAPRLDPPPFKQIGKIATVDKGSSTVVVRLSPGNPTLEEELFVQNSNNEITAKLRPTGIRTGRSVGMVLLQGEVNSGDEVRMSIEP